MRVLIAGCGYVGEELGRQLADNGDAVWGLRRDPGGLHETIRPLAADLLSNELAQVLPPVDAVVYSASANESTDDGYRRIYVEGLRNLLSAVRELGQAPQRLIVVSSTRVYGDQEGATVDESSPTEPEGFRGRRLLEAEDVALASGVRTSVLRLGGIYGPRRTRLLEKVREGNARCPENGPIWSNRIHQEDAAGAIAHILALDAPDPVYLGVDAEPAPLCDVYRYLAGLLDAPEPTVDSAVSRRRSNKRCSSARLQRSGYRFRYPSFREGYRAMVEAGW